jgi:CheY-like chemotaxis protein
MFEEDRPMRVLLAEDHPINRAVIGVILSAVAAELTMVEDGAQAVDAFRASEFDVVLMDIQMPVMDGLSAIREIRRYEAEAGRFPTPILAVTANSMARNLTDCRAAGADHHVSKPVDPDKLLRTMVETVARHALTAEHPLPSEAS